MTNIEHNQEHAAETIKFAIEKLHRELSVDSHYTDIIKSIIEAGERLKTKAGKIGDISLGKEGATEEDIRIERELGAIIDGFQNDSVFFSEEERTDIPPDDARDVWICDPISNTKSFKEGRPGYAVTLARRKEGEMDFAVVYDAARGIIYTAYKGKGAFVNGVPVQIPDISVGKPKVVAGGANKQLREALGNSLTKTDIFEPAKLPAQSVALNTLAILDGTIQGGIILGKDIFPHMASQLIVKEAGGVFTNANGEDELGYTDETFVVGATASLHNDLLQHFQKIAREKGIQV